MNNDQLSPSAAKQMIKLLEAAGHQELASTLKRHLEGRARGASAEELATIWLE